MDQGSEDFSGIDLLLESSRAERYRDPARMLALAEQALAAANLLDPAQYGASRVADIRARVWAELGNAYRLSDRPSQSENAMARAVEYFAGGTHEPQLLALIADRLASLLAHRRLFPEALNLLDRLAEYYSRTGEAHLAGRTLLTRGLYTEAAGYPEQATELTLKSLELIDSRRDRKLLLAALHNLLWFATELGWYEVVARLLPTVRPLYGEDALNLLRLRWVEGRVASGLGHTVEAEQIFHEVRSGFGEKNLIFPASLVTLDLIQLLVPQWRTAEIAFLTEELVVSFRSLRVNREALIALFLLRRATAGEVSLEKLTARILAARQAFRIVDLQLR